MWQSLSVLSRETQREGRPYGIKHVESELPRSQAGAVSERISIRQPVSRAASRAF
jgi:hypothetical protein